MKILYDISPILDGLENGSGRTGIYFCAYHILNEMLARNDMEFAFYSNMTGMRNYGRAMREVFHVPGICLINESRFLVQCSKWWAEVNRRRVFYKRNGKRFRNYFLRIVELMIEGTAGIYEAAAGDPKLVEGFDVYFSPSQQAPKYILKKDSIKKVILLHDTIGFLYPEYFPGMNHWWQGHWAKDLIKGMNNKELFLANSENTKKDFLALKKEIMPQRIKVVYHACSKQFRPCHGKEGMLRVRRKYGIPVDKKYVFSLCTIEPRKNLIRIVKTFVEFVKKNQADDLILVLGGGSWNSFIREFEDKAGRIEGFSDIVYRIGYVDDEDLPLLYSGAFFFVYTSQYEGFGVPPLEAMKCGCPVIASNNSSLPEVMGDAGILIDWDSDEQHMEAYEKYYFDEECRRRQSEKSLLRAEFFSWEKSVDAMIDEMKKELHTNSHKERDGKE